MAEITFEYLALALESVRGTAVTPPTHYANLLGTITPRTSRYRPNESRGTLARSHRSKLVRRWADWQGGGPLDVDLLPVFLNMIAKPVTSPSTPAGATDSRLWEFVPTMTADDLKMATMYWGDPNVQIWQGAFGFCNQLTISNDASGQDGATMQLNGMTQFPAKVSAPTMPMPSQIAGELIAGVNMQLWLDTSSAIGTTEVTGRVVSAVHSLPGGVTPKFIAAGPTADLTYSRIGRGKRQMTTTVVFELLDTTQYDIFAADSTVKLRVRHNGPQIETGFYYYAEVDTYGKLDLTDWGELEGTNRTMTLQVMSEYDATLGADWRAAVQNQRASL